MEPKQIFSVVVMFMLNFEGVHSSDKLKTIRSFFREENRCRGNVIWIQCSNSTAKYCEAKCDGMNTSDPRTHFNIRKGSNGTCIEFRNKSRGYTYALKVVHSQNKTVARFERQHCSEATPEFLFQEMRSTNDSYNLSTGRYYFMYKHTATQKYLSCPCGNKNDGLSLQNDPGDRSNYFLKN